MPQSVNTWHLPPLYCFCLMTSPLGILNDLEKPTIGDFKDISLPEKAEWAVFVTDRNNKLWRVWLMEASVHGTRGWWGNLRFCGRYAILKPCFCYNEASYYWHPWALHHQRSYRSRKQTPLMKGTRRNCYVFLDLVIINHVIWPEEKCSALPVRCKVGD